jgi:hypothetical protein
MQIRLMRFLPFMIGCLLCSCALLVPADDEYPSGAILHFPIPFRLTQTWTYNDHLTLHDMPIVFITGNAVDSIHGARVAVARESLLSNEGLIQLLTTGIADDDERLLHQGHAPQRSRTFTRCDVDNDGVDEVMLSGRGGAGGTTLLYVFAIDESGVKVLYHGAPKFGIVLLDRDDDDILEIWSSGIEFDVDEETQMLRPKQYTVYALKEGAYSQSGDVSREEAEQMFSEHQLRLRLDSANLRVYE